MSNRLIVAFALLLGSSTARAEQDPRDIPTAAPKGCVEPIDGGIPAQVQRGPKLVGVYRLVNGKPLDTPLLRLRAYGQFIPERMGSSRGEVQARFEAQLRTEVRRDGENPDNSKFESAPGVLRIANYRVSLRTVSTKPLTYDAIVEDIGCPEDSTVDPLAAKQSHELWVSTDGVMKFYFSKVRWYSGGDTLQLTLMTGLAPGVQQKDKANPTGHLMLHLFESRDGAPASKEFTNADLAGAKATLLDYKVEVLRVVWGTETKLVDGQLVTRGKEPAGSVLVRVTRLQVTPRPY
ncbi:MAG: hypothetical protein H0V17_31815 [Deltaproteobacteria bacterium]|nr:hypothetical protein [Deltaproteobacteria bacterium]